MAATTRVVLPARNAAVESITIRPFERIGSCTAEDVTVLRVRPTTGRTVGDVLVNGHQDVDFSGSAGGWV
jgi:hypothetical protein